MKYALDCRLRLAAASLPVRGAWIEMWVGCQHYKWDFRRSPCGERGLKCEGKNLLGVSYDVAPRAGSVD